MYRRHSVLHTEGVGLGFTESLVAGDLRYVSNVSSLHLNRHVRMSKWLSQQQDIRAVRDALCFAFVCRIELQDKANNVQ